MAIHFRFRASAKVSQLAAKGWSDNCCEGVRSRQAGLDDIFSAAEFAAGPTELGVFTEVGAAGGIAPTPCATAREADVLSAAEKQTMDVKTSAPVMSGCR